MSFEVVVNDLDRLYRIEYQDPSARLDEGDICRWADLLQIPKADLYDRIAAYLAQGFHRSELTFEFCDGIVNHLFDVILSANDTLPELFWKVYLAFDDGEYCHRDDGDLNPVEKYTKPQIAALLEEIESNSTCG
ncbi:MAG: hypothetical protein JST65_18160 [Acidobacteria bacterium]|nr:hypothetical protein [Acidobacteriota bacterium]